MKRKIIHYIGRLNDGGAESLVREYALHINKKNFDFCVMVNYPFPNTANTQIFEKNGVKIIPIYSKYTFLVKIWDLLMRWWYFPYRIKRILTKENPDVFHVHLELLNYIKPLANYLLKIKLFYTCHTEPTKQFFGKNLKQGKAANYLINKSKMRLIALHNNMANELNEMFGVNNTIVLRNGIDTSKYNMSSQSSYEIRTELGIPYDAYIIGHVGRFNQYKNHAFLLRVFEECLKNNDKAFLLLIGSGETQQFIKDEVSRMNINDHVLILSHRTDVNRLYYCMDVFVFPSIFEGLGIVLVEAQMAGLKCVISNKIPNEVVITNNVKMLSLESSVDEWTHFILNTNEIYCEPVVEKNEYDIDHVVSQLEEFYS